MFKKAASGVLGLLLCSRTRVRSAHQKPCGLAGPGFAESGFAQASSLFEHSLVPVLKLDIVHDVGQPILFPLWKMG